MKRSPADFDLLAAARFFVESMAAYTGASPENRRRLLAGGAEAAELGKEAGEHAMAELRARVGATKIYGKRAFDQADRACRIAEALQVRPALSMKQVAERAGISRAALYRILAKKKRATE